MASIDENVEVGVEFTTSAMRLTGRALVAIMDLFLNKDDKAKHYQKFKDKQGKQKLKDLFSKYEDTTVQSLGENFSAEERKFFEKELKSMGVDFSIKKVGKDNYSLFFAGKDEEAIEKGMENAITKYAKREQRIEKLKNFFPNFKKQVEEEIDEETVDEDLTDEQKEEKVEERINEAYEKEATQAQKDLAKELGIEDYEDMNMVEISLALEEAGADKSYFRDNQNKENKEISYDKEKVDDLYEEARDIDIEISQIEHYENKIQPNLESILADNVDENVNELRDVLSQDATYPTPEDIDNKIEQEYEGIVQQERENLEINKGRTGELDDLKEKYNNILDEARNELKLNKNTSNSEVFNKLNTVFMTEDKPKQSNKKSNKKDNKKDKKSSNERETISVKEIKAKHKELQKEHKEKKKEKTKSKSKSKSL